MTMDRQGVQEGMTVYSSDGEKLGTVQACDADTFVIEKGFFFPKDYVARYADVGEIRDGAIHLARAHAELHDGTAEAGRAAAPNAFDTGSAGIAGTMSAAEGDRAASGRSHEDVRMPVAEEEVDVVKRDRQAGEVRLHKDVVTETKHIEVPVTREEVRVERVPATGERSASAGEASFQDRTVSMPVHEEEIEIRKRPVVKEEVRLRKERFVEQRAADTEVRKERVQVEGEDELRSRRGIADDGTGAARRAGPDADPAPRVDDKSIE